MKLAINYSHQAKQLRLDGKIPVDLLKAALNKEWIEDAKSSGPIYVHFPLGTSPNGVINFDYELSDWTWIFGLMESTATEFLNLHIKVDEADYSKIPSEEKIFRDCQRCIEELTRHVPPSQVIIENVVVRGNAPEFIHPTAFGPFFTHLVAETGCGLLLDTAHLRISCLELGLDFREEVLKFPLHAFKEWHICGVGKKPDKDVLFDSMPMTEDDWQATAFVVAAIREGHAAKPDIVAIEYGGIGDKFEWRSDPMEIFTECRSVRHMLDLI